MTRIKLFAAAMLGAAVTLAGSRLPLPDASTLLRAIRALAHDAGAGLRAMGWEAAHLSRAAGLDTRLDDLAAFVAGLSPAASLIIIASAVGAGIALTAILRRDPEASDAPRHGANRPPDRRVVQARDLARKGTLALDVARQTALPRDAVTLLARLSRPDGVAGGGKGFRRSASA